MIMMVASSLRELQGVAQYPIYDGELRQFPNGTPMMALAVGVGKVQAAITTYEAINRYHPSHVVVVGSCASINIEVKVGDLVVPSSVVQYDIDLRRFGLSRGEVFGVGGKKIGYLDVDRLSHWPTQDPVDYQGIRVWTSKVMGTADRFLVPEDRGSHGFMVDRMHIDAVDMESFAIVAAARSYGVPVTIVKAVSDTWFGERAPSLPRFLEESSKAICSFIARYSEPNEKSPTIL